RIAAKRLTQGSLRADRREHYAVLAEDVDLIAGRPVQLAIHQVPLEVVRHRRKVVSGLAGTGVRQRNESLQRGGSPAPARLRNEVAGKGRTARPVGRISGRRVVDR